jgi:hypothetical protein
MNTVIVPLIGLAEDIWLSPETVSLSNLDNFCRLFLPPPDSETRKQASEFVKPNTEDGTEGDESNAAEGWHPNGFLVVDSAGQLLRRISFFIKRVVDSKRDSGADDADARLLRLWARRLGARRPIATVRRMEQVVIPSAETEVASGVQTATELSNALNGHCDAVIAFEENTSQFRLRAGATTSTRVTALYRSGDLNVLQENLRSVWHWDRDPDDHCAWLGVSPPSLERRNSQIIGAALMFESQITIADQYVGQSLCSDLLYDQYCASKYGDEWAVYKFKWAPTWFESLYFILNSWRTAAVACGNTSSRRCTIVTAARADQWNDVLWFFIARIERRLSICLAGEVSIDVLSKSGGRRVEREEMHPRYIFASTRAVQSDRGFDLLTIDPRKPQRVVLRYAEIASRTLYEARHSQNSWMGSRLRPIPRKMLGGQDVGEQEPEWNPVWSTRKPQADAGVMVVGEGGGSGSQAT